AETDLRNVISDYKTECRPETAPSLRAQIGRLGRQDLVAVLAEVTQMAYSQGPRQWYTQYKVNQAAFSTAVGTVAVRLYEQGRFDSTWLESRRIEKDIVDHLYRRWQILDINRRVIMPAAGTPLHAGWSALEG